MPSSHPPSEAASTPMVGPPTTPADDAGNAPPTTHSQLRPTATGTNHSPVSTTDLPTEDQFASPAGSETSQSTTWPVQKAQNGHNNWIKKDKIKSAKCSICGERIMSYAWECDVCRKRICPACAEPQTGSSSAMHKYIAQNNLSERCSCAYPSGQAPNLRKEMERLGIFAKSTREGIKVIRKEKKSQPPVVPCSHLRSGATIIVGAGVIGLSVALELAKKAKATATSHHVTVVDFRHENTVDTASSSCAGVLNAEGLSEELDNLKVLAQQGWSDHMRTPGLHSEIDLVTNNIFGVQRYKGGGHEYSPTWYPICKYDTFESMEDAMGTIDTQKFLVWLRQQCKAYEVELLLGYDVAEIRGSVSSDISTVIVQQPETESGEIEYLEIGCQNLILAAGPWTTDIFYDLFETSPLQLHNRVRDVHRLCLTRSIPEKRDKKALIFPDLATDEPALEDVVAVVAHEDSEILAYAAGSTVEDDRLPSSATSTKTQSPEATDTLRELIAKRLKISPDSLGSPTSAPTSTATADDMPVIAKIPYSKLTGSKGKNGDEDRRLTGVWLCYGFGMHGTTLAPGVAKGMARWIFGELDGDTYLQLGVEK